MGGLITTNIWLLTAGLLAGMVALSFIVRTVTSRVRRKHEVMHRRWSGAIWNSVRWPLHLFVWWTGWSWLAVAWLTYLQPDASARWAAALERSHTLEVILVVTVFVIALLYNMEKLLGATGAKDGLRSAFCSITRVGRVAVVAVAALLMVDALGYDVSKLMVAGGVGGIVLGFAAKDMLSNVFGALSIYLDRPFVIGDVIEIADKNISGSVEQVSLRMTKIRNFDRQQIYVPNGVFAQSILVNRSRMTHRRLDEFVGVRYDDIGVVEKIAGEVQAMLDAHKDIDSDQSRLCYLARFGPSSVDIRIYVFMNATDWEDFHRVKQDILLKVARIIENNGAHIAYPTQTLHVEMDDKGRERGG